MTRDSLHCDECKTLLDTFHDGEATPQQAEAVSLHVHSCASCAREYELLRDNSFLLHDANVRYTAPDTLRARIQAALAQQQPVLAATGAMGSATVHVVPARRSLWWQIATAAAFAAIVSSAGTYAITHQKNAHAQIESELLSSHVRSLMPNHLTDVVSNDQHNVKPWFNGRVNLSPQVPALDSAGFILVGGRLDYVGARAVAAVVYARRQHVINVYSWPEAEGGAATQTVESNGYHLVQWHTASVSYWAVSDLNVAELSQFVVLFQQHASR